MHHSHIIRVFPCCTLVRKGYSYPEANTVNKSTNLISCCQLQPAVMVENLVENVHECPLNRVVKHTVGSVCEKCLLY